jgi:uncharacterized protein with gpF-like domain
MAKLLTRKKQQWVDERATPMVKGTILRPSAAVEARYSKSLQKLVDEMVSTVEKQLTSLFNTEYSEEFFATEDAALGPDASIASQARIKMNELILKFSVKFNKAAKPIAERMVGEVETTSTLNVWKSLKQLSGGLSKKSSVIPSDLLEMMKASVAENVQLIKSIPEQYLTQVQGAVMRSITGTRGIEGLIKELV